MEKPKEKTELKQKNQKEKGITLIALIVTIVILLILAGITINLVFSDNGIIKKAQEAANKTQEAVENEQAELNQLYNDLENAISSAPEEPQKSEVEKAKEEGIVFQEKTPIKDEKNNTIIIPAGFKIATDSGNTVQQGIVIEDVSASADVNVQGSQYVWIPVGTFIKDEGSLSEKIILGRYTFDKKGKAQLQQAAYTDEDSENYKKEVIIDFGNRSYRRV